MLTDEDIAALWGRGHAATLAKLGPLSAQRRELLATIVEDRIEIDTQMWRRPTQDMKSQKASDVAFALMTVALIGARLKLLGALGFGGGSDGLQACNSFS